MDENKNAIVSINMDISKMETSIISALDFLGLPKTEIFSDVKQRITVFKNIEDVLTLLDAHIKKESRYISKFFAAVSAGLFDAALNYLWDETILQLRNRVSQYDIEYFYDCAVKTEKRSKLKSVEDLIKVDDSELLNGSKEIGLISNIGYKLLEDIKFMRNWASAAHPNNSDLTGLQLITWLETCIREVICLPLENVTVRINTLLENIKNSSLDTNELDNIVVFFAELTVDKVGALANGFFGIFTRGDAPQHCIDNILYLAPKLWPLTSDDVKVQFGIRYAQFGANGDKEKQKLSRQFLEVCNGLQYIPNAIRDSEINEQLAALRRVHESFDNFYNEGMFAKQLLNIVGDKLPVQIIDRYVNTIVYVYLSNGYGIASSADPYYETLISGFDSRASMKAIVSLVRDDISLKLKNRKLCRMQYLKLIELVLPKITAPMFKDFTEKLSQMDLKTAPTDEKIRKQIELMRQYIK